MVPIAVASLKFDENEQGNYRSTFVTFEKGLEVIMSARLRAVETPQGQLCDTGDQHIHCRNLSSGECVNYKLA